MIQILSPTVCKTLASLLAVLAMGSAWAESSHEKHGRGHGHERERYVFRNHDVRHFEHNDLIRWRGGHWNNSCFGGRCGWWWLAAGQWYFYERPIYPYPLVVSGIEFVEPAYVEPAHVAPAYVEPPYVEPAYVEPAPAAIAAQPGAAAPPQFWYYCDNPQGYFPAVQTCNMPFRQVPPPPPPK